MFASTETFRILSIDPGSNTCGFSVLDCCMATGNVVIVLAVTVTAKDVLVNKSELLSRFCEKTVKILGYADRLASFIAYFNPDVVVSEAPYFRRIPQPFRVLSELTFEFSRVVATTYPKRDFILIDPGSVKLAVGVKNTSNDKEDMRRALAKITEVSYVNNISLDSLDEHAIDSICVGLWFFRRIHC